jgi:predicted MFS family arabinose efflux permease
MLALAATLAIQALVTMIVLTPPIFAPLAAPAMGVAASQAGLFMACIYAGASIASLISGSLLRRFGAMRLSQLCLVTCSLGIVLIASASLPLVVAAGVVIGLGYGPVTPASSHILVRQTTAENRAFIFSVKQTGVPLGGVLAGALAPILALTLGWRAAAVAVGAAGVLLAVMVEPLRQRFDGAEAPPYAAGDRRGVFEGLRPVLGHTVLRRFGLASIGFAATQLCFSTFLVAFLTERVGLDLIAAGAVLAVGQTAGVAARILWGWLADRFIAPWRLLALLGAGMAAATVGVGFFGAAWPRAAIMAVAVVLGATAIGWNGIYLAEVARLAPPGAAGAATGGGLALTFLGIVAGPPLFSLIVASSGSYRLAFIAIAAGALVGGLACLGAGRRQAG